jgi:hypothetical protein
MTEKTAPNLGLKYGYAIGESGWGAGYNANHLLFDTLLQLSVVSAALAAPPGAPANGDRYIIAASPTGAWAGHAGALAVWLTDLAAWTFYAPRAGWRAYNVATGTVVTYSGSAWVVQASGAPLDSPAFTGTPTAPTATAGTNTTQLSTTAFVSAALAAMVNASPATLDTLKELADALGDDPSFAATMATALGLKAPLVSPAFTGTPTAPTATDATSNTQLATTAFVHAVAIAAAGGVAYTLPTASPSVLGGVKDGAGLTVTGDGTLNVDVPVPAPAGALALPLRANAAATALEYYSPPYDVALFVEGVMTNAETVLRFVAPRAFTLAAGATGAAKAGTAAVGSTVLTISKNGAGIGTLTWAAAGTVATVNITSATAFAAGDVLAIVGPATADAALADIAISLAGTRS